MVSVRFPFVLLCCVVIIKSTLWCGTYVVIGRCEGFKYRAKIVIYV